MLATILAGFDINFACILIMDIHKRAFMDTTTFPSLYIIFQLCIDV